MWSNYVIIVEGTCTSESMNPRPCFLALQYRLRSLLSLATLLFYIFILQILISTIHIALVSPSLRWTSAPIQFTIVFGVLGTQETLVIWLQGCLRETIFILRLPQIDKPCLSWLNRKRVSRRNSRRLNLLIPINERKVILERKSDWKSRSKIITENPRKSKTDEQANELAFAVCS